MPHDKDVRCVGCLCIARLDRAENLDLSGTFQSLPCSSNAEWRMQYEEWNEIMNEFIFDVDETSLRLA